MMNRGVDKGMSAAVAVVILALIRPETVPSMWITALIALGLYEIALLTIRIARQHEIQTRRKVNAMIRRQNGRRWADEQFNPLRQIY